MSRSAQRLFLLLLGIWGVGCANVVPPSGGDKDTEPPKLISVSPTDSALNARPARIELRFDEYVTVGDASNIQISPLLPVPLTATANGKKVTVRIPDTSLQEGTTYRIRFGAAIQDLHEGNPFGNYAYTFSTGSYFDSLGLSGKVIVAATGLPDSGATVILHPATEDDTAVLRRKPLYTTRTDGLGQYSFEGLPAKPFRLYAVGDNNGNLTADGGERIAFLDSLVIPAVAQNTQAILRTFIEADDTAQTGAGISAFRRRGLGDASVGPTAKAGSLNYSVSMDTGDVKARTLDLTDPLRILFSGAIAPLNKDRIFLSYDSSGTTLEAAVNAVLDTPGRTVAKLAVAWRPDALYTLRLLKGFARDTAGIEAAPSRYRFRTKREDDYGKLQVRIPTAYYGQQFLLQVLSETDTVYTAPVTDSTVQLKLLRPSNYTLRIIEDSNRNGRWDPGDLLRRRQPEMVMSHSAPVPLKAGWEAVVDFEATGTERRKKEALGTQRR